MPSIHLSTKPSKGQNPTCTSYNAEIESGLLCVWGVLTYYTDVRGMILTKMEKGNDSSWNVLVHTSSVSIRTGGSAQSDSPDI